MSAICFRGMIGKGLLEWEIGQSTSVHQVKNIITTVKQKYLSGRNRGNG